MINPFFEISISAQCAKSLKEASMRTKSSLLVILMCIFTLFLVGCESIAQAQQLQPTASAVELSSSNAVSSTPAQNKSAVQGRASILSSMGASENRDQSIGMGSELGGTWTSGTVQLTIKLLPQLSQNNVGGIARFKGLPEVDSLGADCEIYENFSYQNQMITWGTMSFSCKAADFVTPDSIQAWSSQPASTYRVTIIQEEGKSSMIFSMDAEDPITLRKDFLSGNTFTRINTTSPKP
jgi:hypothetical protein